MGRRQNYSRCLIKNNHDADHTPEAEAVAQAGAPFPDTIATNTDREERPVAWNSLGARLRPMPGRDDPEWQQSRQFQLARYGYCCARGVRNPPTKAPEGSAAAAFVDPGGSDMSIECAFSGFMAADAERRTSQAGKAWTRLRVGVGKDDDVQWVSVAVFGKYVEAAAELKKADKVYIEGTISLNTWKGGDGVERAGLSVAAWKCEQTHLIGRNKPKRETTSKLERARKPAGANTFYNDEIPF
jgi:single-stranded DNA-binding protein